MSKIYNGSVTDGMKREETIESLRQKLAAALAACQVKHNALHFANEELRMYAEEDGEDYTSLEINEALAATADLKEQGK